MKVTINSHLRKCHLLEKHSNKSLHRKISTQQISLLGTQLYSFIKKIDILSFLCSHLDTNLPQVRRKKVIYGAIYSHLTVSSPRRHLLCSMPCPSWTRCLPVHLNCLPLRLKSLLRWIKLGTQFIVFMSLFSPVHIYCVVLLKRNRFFLLTTFLRETAQVNIYFQS